MQSLGMGQAINQALREEMLRDADVFLAGEGIGVGIHSSPMLPTAGLLEDFGPDAKQYADWLAEHGGDLKILQYGFRIQKREMKEYIVSGNIDSVREKVMSQVEAVPVPTAISSASATAPKNSEKDPVRPPRRLAGLPCKLAPRG